MSRAVRNFLHRLSKSQGKQFIRLRIPFTNSLKSFHLIGSFTENPWTDEMDFIYSISNKEYYLEVWVRPGDEFLVKSLNEVLILDEYPSKKDKYGTYVNLIPTSIDDFTYLQNLQRLQIMFESQLLDKDKSCLLKGSYWVIKKDGKPCEDRCFFNRRAFGIADGVSAWRHRGIDSGIFAEDFLGGCKTGIERYLRYGSRCPNTPTSLHDNTFTCFQNCFNEVIGKSDKSKDLLKEIADEAFSQTFSYGSCTFILGVLEGNLLRICNLGDSSLLIFRYVQEKPMILLRTISQQHRFNTPFQICNTPPYSTHNYTSDSPESGQSYEVNVREGDIIIAGSDGLWDNLFPKDIEEIVLEYRGKIQKLAKAIAKKAYIASKNNSKTPFEEAVGKKYGPGFWKGGKPDDISVVTAIVSR